MQSHVFFFVALGKTMASGKEVAMYGTAEAALGQKLGRCQGLALIFSAESQLS